MADYESHLRPDRGLFPLSELAERSAKDFGPHPAMRRWANDDYEVLTFDEVKDNAHSIARWLIGQEIKRGDRVAVLGENRPEWAFCYLGVQTSGAVVVPVDRLMPPNGIRHILANSGTKILFVSGQYLSVINEMAKIDTLEKIVCFDAVPDDNDTILLENVIQQGRDIEVKFPKRELDELAAILYTSGTTGHSKGVMLSQRNIISNVAQGSRVFPVGTEDTFLSVLPMHHVFEATCGFLLPLYCGASVTYAKSLKSSDIVSGIKDTEVTLMVGVPLLYEKMHAGILRGIRKKGKEKAFNTMYGVVSAAEKIGLKLGKKIFKGLREKAGFGTVKIFASGGGPLDPTTYRFFNRLGITMLQGYGLTETSPITHLSPPWKTRDITVGPNIPDVECKLINKNKQGIGEVCVKGPNIFMGYYQNQEATDEVMDKDGFFMTGDLGMIHPDGYLQIMGREKNMLVTGGGKNVYPEEVEHYLNQSKFIAESLVLGKPRESGYGEEIIALINPDYEQVDLHYEALDQKPSDKDIYELIKGEITETQQDIADYKRVRRFRIVEEEFQKTSTRKVKRFLYKGDEIEIG